MRKPLFIAFEGIDGSGKSTQIRLLKDRLEAAGEKVFVTCEPSNSPMGKAIRDIFSHRIQGDHLTIAALFVADRLHHILNQRDGILKMLEDGHVVITDRYYFSSYAYQSIHIDQNWIFEANSLSAKLLRPDINIYIDITPEESIVRLEKGRTSIELYETLENLQNVHRKYFEVMELLKDEEKVFVTNGSLAPTAIAQNIWSYLENELIQRD